MLDFVGPIHDRSVVTAARRLHTRTYLDAGYIDEQQCRDRLFEDGWMGRSQWVAAIAGDDVAGCLRLVEPDDDGRLPTSEMAGLDLTDHPTLGGPAARGRIQELSALVVDKQRFPEPLLVSMELYRAAWRLYRTDAGLDAWLMCMEPHRLEVLDAVFPVTFERHGRFVAYRRPLVVATLDLRTVVPTLSEVGPDLLDWFDPDVTVDVTSHPTSTPAGVS